VQLSKKPDPGAETIKASLQLYAELLKQKSPGRQSEQLKESNLSGGSLKYPVWHDDDDDVYWYLIQ
jgi:hypothetical protein